MWLCNFSVQSNPFAIKFLFFCGSAKNPSLKAVDLSSHTWSGFCPPLFFSRDYAEKNQFIPDSRSYECVSSSSTSLYDTLLQRARLQLVVMEKTSRNEFRGWGGRSGNWRHVDSPTKMPDTEYRALSADAALCQRMWRVLMRSQR